MHSVAKISLSALFLIFFFPLLTYDPLWVIRRRHGWYVTGERLQSAAGSPAGLGTWNIPKCSISCSSPVGLCCWAQHRVSAVSGTPLRWMGPIFVFKCDMLDIQQLLPQSLTCSARINPKGLFRGEWNEILFLEQQQRSLKHQWLVSTVAITSSRCPVGSGPKLDSKKLSKLSAAP